MAPVRTLHLMAPARTLHSISTGIGSDKNSFIYALTEPAEIKGCYAKVAPKQPELNPAAFRARR